MTKRPSNVPSMISKSQSRTCYAYTKKKSKIPRNMTKNVPQIEFSRQTRTIIFIIINIFIEVSFWLRFFSLSICRFFVLLFGAKKKLGTYL